MFESPWKYVYVVLENYSIYLRVAPSKTDRNQKRIKQTKKLKTPAQKNKTPF